MTRYIRRQGQRIRDAGAAIRGTGGPSLSSISIRTRPAPMPLASTRPTHWHGGKPARQLMEQNVFAFRGRSGEDGQWWSEAPHLFVDSGNPFVMLPQLCVFEFGGQRSERKLRWRANTAQARDWQDRTMSGDAMPVGLTQPRNNLFWMSMPNFKPSESERITYRQAYRRITTVRSRFLQADAIVIDQRGPSVASAQTEAFHAALRV